VIADVRKVKQVYGRLVVAEGGPQRAHWAQNIWFEPFRVRFESIADAARQLCAVQRNWWPYSFRLHRRTALIQERLPHVSARAVRFPEPAPAAQLGSFMLVSDTELIASARCSSPFPNGEPQFIEFNENDGPPNRAYLKLFEALTLLGKHPTTGELCLDLGASPGGWSWVLATLGARVIAVDRAPLAPQVAALTGVRTLQDNAFNATPERVGPIDWLVSDVVCYPEKLFGFIRRWLDSGKCHNFICTLKFQGPSHYAVIEDFARIEQSTLIHLHHNKHELTWMQFRGAGGL
jgi:23S rRNA (cytidine2498-2'-O)-methyltransferase